jgi:hypothetical protein
MIDSIALSSLATAALMMHHPDKGRDVPDLRYPADVAREVVGVARNGHTLDDACAFGLGFAFALNLGALLAVEPLRRPDLTDLISEYEKLVRREYVDRLDEVATS